MNSNWTGVWIDHRNALIVRPNNGDVELTTVPSALEPQHKSTGGKAKSRPFMHENAPSSASHSARASENAMGKYLSIVAQHVAQVSNILILGPGNTKELLRNLLAQEESPHHSREIALEAAEQMTEPQLKARVLLHFGRPASRNRRGAPGEAPHITGP